MVLTLITEQDHADHYVITILPYGVIILLGDVSEYVQQYQICMLIHLVINASLTVLMIYSLTSIRENVLLHYNAQMVL